MDRRYVGIDLHRRRSVIYAMDAQGDRLFCERITNDALRLLEVVSAAGEGADVVIEATYGWYWAVDLLQNEGFSVHLAHPSGNDWGNRRVKNDERDARDLADLLRLGRLAEAWIAPPSVREARTRQVSSEVGAATQWPQGAGACGDGQRRRAARDE